MERSLQGSESRLGFNISYPDVSIQFIIHNFMQQNERIEVDMMWN